VAAISNADGIQMMMKSPTPSSLFGSKIEPAPSPGAPPFPDMVWIPGGTFRMGSNKHYPEERPQHRVSVDGFWMDREPVCNERFSRFVESTGHQTFAELPPNPADYPDALPRMLFAGSLASDIPAAADVFRPAYLELRQKGAETFDVLWKVPAKGDTMRLAIHVVFPDGTVRVSEPRGTRCRCRPPRHCRCRRQARDSRTSGPPMA
jgi:hypothetical protein